MSESGECRQRGHSKMNALRQFDGKVQKLLSIATLVPLSEFPFALRPLTTHLRSVGYGWSLLTGVRSLRDGVPDDTLRVCMIVWSSNIADAVLVSRCEDNFVKESWKTTELPPIEYFVPSSTGWTYGEIHAAGRGALMECAV